MNYNTTFTIRIIMNDDYNTQWYARNVRLAHLPPRFKGFFVDKKLDKFDEVFIPGTEFMCNIKKE